MVDIKTFTAISASFPEATQEPHFEKTSFRVHKKIFATLDTVQNRVCVKLSEIDQDVFCSIDRSAIYPIPNKWGKQGWTFIELAKVDRELLMDALTRSYCGVAPKKLSALLKQE